MIDAQNFCDVIKNWGDRDFRIASYKEDMRKIRGGILYTPLSTLKRRMQILQEFLEEPDGAYALSAYKRVDRILISLARPVSDTWYVECWEPNLDFKRNLTDIEYALGGNFGSSSVTAYKIICRMLCDDDTHSNFRMSLADMRIISDNLNMFLDSIRMDSDETLLEDRLNLLSFNRSIMRMMCDFNEIQQ